MCSGVGNLCGLARHTAPISKQELGLLMLTSQAYALVNIRKLFEKILWFPRTKETIMTISFPN